jgi:hypothetical protein
VKLAARLLVAAAALGSLAACGWRAGLPRPAGATTLAVAFPGNDTLLRDLEVLLAQALAEAALDRIDLRPVGPGDADLVIRGTLVDFRRGGGVRSPENGLLEARPTIAIRVALVERATGNELARADRTVSAGLLVPPDTSPTRAPDEFATRERVARNLAESLILELFDPLAYGTGSTEGP